MKKATYLVTNVIAPKCLTNCQDDFFRLIICDWSWQHSEGLQSVADRLSCDCKVPEALDGRRDVPLRRTKGLPAG